MIGHKLTPPGSVRSGAAGTAVFAHQNPGVNNGVAIHVDADGNAISNAISGNASSVEFNGQASAPDGSLYFLGASASGLPGFYGSPLASFPGGTSNAGLIVKLAADGNTLYHTYQGEATAAQAFTDGALLSDSSLVVATTSSASYGAPLSPHSGSGGDYAISRYAADGSLIWLTFTGGAGNDDVTALTTASHNSVWIGGTSDVSFGAPIAPFTHQGGGSNHSTVFRVNRNGTADTCSAIGGSGPPVAYAA